MTDSNQTSPPADEQELVAALLPTPWGVFQIYGMPDSDKEHIVLTMGDVAKAESPLARIHSECLTGDALFSLRCDCGPQLEASLAAIAKEGVGILIYLRQEGRGIGLHNKIKAYALQDEGLDTVDANEQLGFAADMRDYSVAQAFLQNLGVQQIRLMTNNPTKVEALEKLGIKVVERVPHKFGDNPHNERYLKTKHGRLGHLL